MISLCTICHLQYADRLWKPLRFARPFGPLFVCIVGITSVYIGQLDTLDRGSLAIVGAIPAGLPPWTANQWAIKASGIAPDFSVLFPTAIVVMFVDMLESTSIAR